MLPSPSRLTSAVNPESGTYTYSYTNSSGTNLLALQSRTDPRGYKTTYGYDSMDKVTSVTYNDGTPNSSYTYNANGQMTQSSNSTAPIIFDTGATFLDIVIDTLERIACVGSGACEVLAGGAVILTGAYLNI